MRLRQKLLFRRGAFDQEPDRTIDKIHHPHPNEDLRLTQMVLGVSQISLGIIAFWMRSLRDRSAMSGAMTIVAVIFLLFGLEAILVDFVVEGMTRNMILFIQGIVFILLAIIFFLSRKPKTKEE